MDADNEFRLSLLEGASHSPPATSNENMGESPDSAHTNGFQNGGSGEAAPVEGSAEDAGEAGGGEGDDAGDDGEPMELEDPVGGNEGPTYIGDNCISTPAHTESNSPQMDQEGDGEGDAEGMAGEGEGDSMEGEGEGDGDGGLEPGEVAGDRGGSPDQSVSSNTTAEEEMGLSKEASVADVASSDDVTPADVSSGSIAMDTLQTQGISSSTLDNSTAISSSAAPESEELCSSSALVQNQVVPIMNTMADTSILSQQAVQLQQPLHYGQQLVSNSTHTAVSSSNISLVNQQQVSSTCAELSGGEESAVSSSVGSNGSVPMGDALATLASAALNRQQSQEVKPEKEEEPWFTVGIVKGTTFTVQSFIADSHLDLSTLSMDNIPDLSGLDTLPLEPGTGYKFRVAALNSCGRGEFGEESAFKTCVPGYPGAPSDIKISKSAEGAHLSWEPPQASPEGIFEYSVYLAVRPMNPLKETAPKSQLTFVRVYCGKATSCTVASVSLSNAHVDSSTKPAIIFRIAARNDKGYGPATQVRWLQENKGTGVKRILSDGRPSGGPPPKQSKPIMH